MLLWRDRARRAPRHDPAEYYTAAHNNFLEIPAEILGTIYRQSSLRDAAALALTCTRFYYSDVAAVHVHERLKSSKEAQFELLCVLEDDSLIKGYHCRGCIQRHPLRSFSWEELRKRSGDRDCLRTKKCLLLSPNEPEISFNDMVGVLRQSYGPPETIWKREPDVYLLKRQKSLYTVFPLFKTKYVKNKAGFVALCTGFNIPLCPHLRLNDNKITRQFPPRHLPWLSHLPGKFRNYAKCELCATELHLFEGRFGRWDGWFVLEVTRYLGNFKTPRDPDWLAQTFAEKDPCLDTYYEDAKAWLEDAIDDLQRRRPLPAPPVHLEPENGSFFSPATLPRASVFDLVEIA